MKKKLFALLIVVFSIMPVITVNASVEKTNLKEAVAEEIELVSKDTSGNYKSHLKTLKKFDSKSYKEGSGKVTVYIFRGNTCPHCLDAVVYFSSIYEEYKDKIDVITYEVYNNSDNASFMKEVAEELGTSSSGIPLIVIGEKTFSGYGESMNKDLIDAIETEYKNSNYIDAVSAIKEGTYISTNKDKEEEEKEVNKVVGYIVIGVTILIIIGIIVSRFNSASYYDNTTIEELESVIESEPEEVIEEKEIKTTKKTTAKKVSAKKTTTKKKTTKKK